MIVTEVKIMGKYIKEISVTVLQLLIFYLLPLFAGPTDAIGMVFLLIWSAIILSFMLGIISDSKLKFLYPIAISILFIPSVFIYYNESALIHAIWYLVVSTIGMSIGSLIHKLINSRQ